MLPDPQLVAELRALFKAGATPSRLMRQIVARHESLATPEMDRLIRAYFRDAFGIAMFRASSSILEHGLEGLKVAGINANVIHAMVENRSAWDHELDSVKACETGWLDLVNATNEAQLLEQARPEISPEFAGVWSQLDDGAKAYLKRLIAGSQAIYEKAAILSVLVEQLQQQVNTLQDQPAAAG